MQQPTKKDLAVESAIEYKIKRIMESVFYFIEKYVYIEDKTSPDGICKLCLWPKQQEAMHAINEKQFLIFLKARQLGLTWLVLVWVLWMMLRTKAFLAIAISKRDDPDAIELSNRIQLMLRHLPKWLIREQRGNQNWNGLTYEANDHEITIYRPDGEPSRFMTLPASPDTAHSFTANVVILDEWALHPFAKAIWTGAFPTMNRADFSGKLIGLSTGRRNTLFEEIWNGAKKGLNNFYAIFLNWRADPRRDDAWHEKTKKILPNTWRSQYPNTEADAFAVGEGAFFEEWDEEVHVPVKSWEPPNSRRWLIVGAYDPGFSSHACFKWYAISPDGWARCFREYYPHRVTDKDQAAEIIRRSVYYNDDNKPMEFDYIVADSDAWTPSRDSGKSTADVFFEYDSRLNMSLATKDLENGWRRLHEWLQPYDGPDGKKTALLTFTADCANTICTYPSCEQSESNPEDISKKSEHHCQDVDRYFVMSRPEPAKEPKKELKGVYTEDELLDKGLSRAEIREMKERGQVI
jgi:hypothetical protein